MITVPFFFRDVPEAARLASRRIINSSSPHSRQFVCLIYLELIYLSALCLYCLSLSGRRELGSPAFVRQWVMTRSTISRKHLTTFLNFASYIPQCKMRQGGRAYSTDFCQTQIRSSHFLPSSFFRNLEQIDGRGVKAGGKPEGEEAEVARSPRSADEGCNDAQAQRGSQQMGDPCLACRHIPNLGLD